MQAAGEMLQVPGDTRQLWGENRCADTDTQLPRGVERPR
jgi:hypothetical protein